ILTSTWWRNAWKYEARAYRHAFWDSGTILANLLAVASGRSIAAQVVVGFADADVNALLDVNPVGKDGEGAIALIPVGRGASVPPPAPAVSPLGLPTRALSPQQVDSPAIVQAHTSSSLPSGAAAANWRADFSTPPAGLVAPDDGENEPIEAVILRRGSSRRF